MMKCAQLIKIYRAMYLIIWFIKGTWDMIDLVRLIKTHSAHAPMDVTRTATIEEQSGQRIE